MSLDEFLALPEEKPYLELIDGEVCQKPFGSWPHSTAQSLLLRLLGEHAHTCSGAAYVELTLPIRSDAVGNVRQPDVSFYRPGRGAPDADDYPTELPDLVAEVRSDGQTVGSLESRLAFLRERGVMTTLFIDPETLTVTVHDGDRSWGAISGERVVIDSLGGFDFDVDELFEP